MKHEKLIKSQAETLVYLLQEELIRNQLYFLRNRSEYQNLGAEDKDQVMIRSICVALEALLMRGQTNSVIRSFTPTELYEMSVLAQEVNNETQHIVQLSEEA